MTLRRILLAGIVPSLLGLALMFAACGGDDDGSSGGSGGSTSAGAGSDEKYVAAVCKAFKNFGDATQKAVKNAGNIKNEDDIVKALTGPIDDLVGAMSKASPPKDAKAAHDETVKVFKAALADLKKNGAKSTAFTDIETPKMEQAVSDRLDKVAAKNKDCKDADISFAD